MRLLYAGNGSKFWRACWPTGHHPVSAVRSWSSEAAHAAQVKPRSWKAFFSLHAGKSRTANGARGFSLRHLQQDWSGSFCFGFSAHLVDPARQIPLLNPQLFLQPFSSEEEGYGGRRHQIKPPSLSQLEMMHLMTKGCKITSTFNNVIK